MNTAIKKYLTMKRHQHEWGDSGLCVHCGAANPLVAAEEKAANYLARGNEHKERGNLSMANKFFERSAQWLMKANELRGWQ